MTFNELLKACANGRMPEVELLTEPVKFSKQTRGIVTTIKDNGRHKGVAVRFLDLDYDTWFHDSSDLDRRSRYMRELKLTTESSFFPTKESVLKSASEDKLI